MTGRSPKWPNLSRINQPLGFIKSTCLTISQALVLQGPGLVTLTLASDLRQKYWPWRRHGTFSLSLKHFASFNITAVRQPQLNIVSIEECFTEIAAYKVQLVPFSCAGLSASNALPKDNCILADPPDLQKTEKNSALSLTFCVYQLWFYAPTTSGMHLCTWCSLI